MYCSPKLNTKSNGTAPNTKLSKRITQEYEKHFYKKVTESNK